MAKTWCLVQKGARALVGVPSLFKEDNNAEYIGFNAGRIYGSIQIPHLFANWEQGIYYHLLLYPVYGNQPIFYHGTVSLLFV